MKQLAKWMITFITVLVLTGTASAALAQDNEPLPPQLGGLRGQVTAVSDTALTVQARNGQSVKVMVSTETEVLLIAEGGSGSLADIQTGDWVGVRGPRQDDGSVQARLIALLPADFDQLDKARGRVTAVEGSVIVLENRQGSLRIATTAETKFRNGKEDGSLTDVKPGNFALALGRKENDTLSASVVVTISPEQIKKHVLRGEVLSVDETAGTLVVEAKGGKSGQWTVITTPETKIRFPKVDNPTLADIPVGTQVVVMGRPAEDSSQTFTARGIGVIPAEFQGSLKLMGEVTGVGDNNFTVLTQHRGEVTVLVDVSTEYRARGNQTPSFADIKVGTKVLVAGEPVEGQKKTVKAKLVGLKK